MVEAKTDKAAKVAAAKAKLGDAFEPCKNYLTASSVCMLQNMKFTLPEEPDNACEKLPELLELIPEEKRGVCKEMTPKPDQISSQVISGVHSSNNPNIKVETKNTIRKPFSFAEKMKNPEDGRNCEAYIKNFRACEASKGSETNSCIQYPRFFEKISKEAQPTCTEMSDILDMTIQDTKDVLKQKVYESIKTKFEL